MILLQALEYGILERDFWDMTIAEVRRQVEGAAKAERRQMQNRAIMDYTLASLIANFTFGKQKVGLYDAYPSLFKEEKTEEEQIKLMDAKSAANFIAFAVNYNNKVVSK